ncbi:MAG: hypothetical protein KatS3mg031_3041 [Chitinophagales bacterium]|nr:MAG: hypothetical protein KatS3mg031_3041 [Chitinophagales bacterium]
MKKQFVFAIIGAVLLMAQRAAMGQGTWISNGTLSNYFVQPDNTAGMSSDYIRAVGIGYFGSNQPLSFLHIDGNTITRPSNWPAGSEGEVFRTQAPSTVTQAWRMLHGTANGGIGTQVFNINNVNGSANVSLGTVQDGSLNFFTNLTNFPSPRMIITGGNNTAGGNVGIGYNFVPAHRLDVNEGDINVNTINKGYRIGGSGGTPSKYVLWHNGDIANIYVGADAGNANGIGTSNTFVGNGAGQLITNGNRNMFLGKAAGTQNTSGSDNVFIGESAGSVNQTGGQNVYVGQRSGVFSTSSGNSFVGFQSGAMNTVGDSNVFVGYKAGFGNTIGSANTFIGYNAQGAGTPNNLNNATTIGANTIARVSNSMILGDNNANVGIGLSNDPSGPLNKLEINADPNNFTHTGIGGSGLKFRQLYNVAGEVTSPNPGPGVLSVDLNGNVILVPDATGGDVSACQNPTPPSFQNYLAKWSPSANTVCNTIVYEDVSAPTNIKIGIDINSNLLAKLHVQNSSENTAVYGISSGTFPEQSGLVGESGNATKRNFGVIGMSITPSGSPAGDASNIGVYGIGEGSDVVNIGAMGFANYDPGDPAPPNLYNLGVLGRASGSLFQNIAGAFEANNQLGINIGIYASAAADRNWAAVFNGNTFAFGQYGGSDLILKDSIENVSGALDVLSQIESKSFIYKRDSFPYLNLDSLRHFGFIAQQVDSILPSLVKEIIFPAIIDTNGTVLMDTLIFKSINYSEFTALLVNAVNELNTAKVSSCATPTDSNYVTKWDAVNNVLCNTLIYDNGTNVGIGISYSLDGARLTVRGGTGLAGIQAQGDTIGAIFTGGMAGIYSFTDSVTPSHAGVVAVSENATVANIGILGSAGGVELPGPEDDPMNIGVAGLAQIPTENKNIGVIAMSQRSSAFNAAVMALSEDEEADTAVNAGVIAFASGSDSVNVGGFFGAEDSTGINIGIYATATGSDSSSAGHFAGDITVTGSVYETSDQKLKRNITDMDAQDALEVIKALKPKSYEYRTEDYRMLSLQEGVRHGLIAQEVEQILPELVTTRVQPEIKGLQGKTLSERADFKAVNYTGFIPYLISAMQAQQATIEEQQSRIDSLSSALRGRLTNLENTINQCCGVGYRQSNPEDQSGDEEGHAKHLTVELSSLQVVILEQNVPNPFKEQTSISYFIPEESGKAQMLFFDITGRIIKTVELQKGYGIMTVFAQNLSSGTYSYSLVIDGEVVETKRMVKR